MSHVHRHKDKQNPHGGEDFSVSTVLSVHLYRTTMTALGFYFVLMILIPEL